MVLMTKNVFSEFWVKKCYFLKSRQSCYQTFCFSEQTTILDIFEKSRKVLLNKAEMSYCKTVKQIFAKLSNSSSIKWLYWADDEFLSKMSVIVHMWYTREIEQNMLLKYRKKLIYNCCLHFVLLKKKHKLFAVKYPKQNKIWQQCCKTWYLLPKFIELLSNLTKFLTVIVPKIGPLCINTVHLCKRD